MAIAGQAPRLLLRRLGARHLPSPIGLLGGPMPRSKFKLGSKIRRIDDFLRRHPYHFRHGPKYCARILTVALRVHVFDTEVCRVLESWQYTRKKISVVPSRSRPQERLQHRLALQVLNLRDDMVRSDRVFSDPTDDQQLVYVDEKAFLFGEVKKRLVKFGYARRGHRVPLRCALCQSSPILLSQISFSAVPNCHATSDRGDRCSRCSCTTTSDIISWPG